MREGQLRLPDLPDRSGKRVGADSALRRELALCERLGISHSHFLGGPDRWTDLDRVNALEHASWKQECCSHCGTHPDWWDPEKGGHPNALVADSWRCPGCEILAQLDEQIPSNAKGVHTYLAPNRELTGDRK